MRYFDSLYSVTLLRSEQVFETLGHLRWDMQRYSQRCQRYLCVLLAMDTATPRMNVARSFHTVDLSPLSTAKSGGSPSLSAPGLALMMNLTLLNQISGSG